MENSVMALAFEKLAPADIKFCIGLFVVSGTVIVLYGMSNNYSFNLGSLKLVPQTGK